MIFQKAVSIDQSKTYFLAFVTFKVNFKEDKYKTNGNLKIIWNHCKFLFDVRIIYSSL